MTSPREIKLRDQSIRLVPKPLWGISLAALCSTKTWRSIKSGYLESANCRCIFHDHPGQHNSPLEAHERWHYDLSGVATLQDIWSLCTSCHSIFHPGRILSRHGYPGLHKLEALYARTADISLMQAKGNYMSAFQKHVISSKISRWRINLDICSSHFPLSYKKSKEAAIRGHDWVANPFNLEHISEA